MAFGWTSSKAMILASFFLTCYVSVSIEAYIAAKPSGLNVPNIRGTASSKTSMRMAIDMSAPTEEPMSVVVQPVAAPSQIVKQFSSSRVSSINLLKNCLGAGVFSLNARVSAISGSPMTIIPAAALVITMAMWATYNFYMVSAFHGLDVNMGIAAGAYLMLSTTYCYCMVNTSQLVAMYDLAGNVISLKKNYCVSYDHSFCL